jgi:hypothetical protein
VTLIQTPLNRVNGAEEEDSPTLKLGEKLMASQIQQELTLTCW